MGIIHGSLGVWLTILLLTQDLGAVVKPDVARLARIGFQINGEDQDLRMGQALELIRGDQLTLLYAALEGTQQGPESLNFVGFRGEGPRRYLEDDRYVAIDTTKLKRGWSLDRQGRVYRIQAKSGKTVHGEVEVLITQPELEQLELQINERIETLGPGAAIDLQASDRIQIKQVRTNHPRLDREARVRFQEQGVQDGMRIVQLQLLHREFLFASMWLRIKP